MIRIKELRKRLGMTQKEFAVANGMTQSSLSLYEKGSVIPSTENLVKIAKKYNVSLDWLCDNNVVIDINNEISVVKLIISLLEVDYASLKKTSQYDYRINLEFCKGENSLLSYCLNEYLLIADQLSKLTDTKTKNDLYSMWRKNLYEQLNDEDFLSQFPDNNKKSLSLMSFLPKDF